MSGPNYQMGNVLMRERSHLTRTPGRTGRTLRGSWPADRLLSQSSHDKSVSSSTSNGRAAWLGATERPQRLVSLCH